MRITESLVVDAPPAAVFDLYRDLEAWPRFLEDVESVELLYDDGYQQEFSMTVSRPGGLETVRGVRYCRRPAELEMCQFTPPPMLTRMSGLWTFQEAAGGRTLLTAERTFTTRDRDGEATFAEPLRGHLRANLLAFAKEVSRAPRR